MIIRRFQIKAFIWQVAAHGGEVPRLDCCPVGNRRGFLWSASDGKHQDQPLTSVNMSKTAAATATLMVSLMSYVMLPPSCCLYLPLPDQTCWCVLVVGWQDAI